MATLKHLQIGGIRSFGAEEEDRQIISFDKPFTLILGRNGCGKTTIIESLKFACTGTFPSGQGANFVRDPKIDGVSETRAQVKLKFTSCKGQTVCVSKLMSLTQKYRTLQFKTLGVSTSVEENGKVNQLSSRHINAETFVCSLLGVSKPILNYVIFCHQEESHWPLDEGKKLKERFDEIFDSTKYNKCMDTIRQIRKSVLTEIKVADEALKHLKQNVDIVNQKRGELEQYTARLNETKEKLENHKKDKTICQAEYEVWVKKDEDYMKMKERRDGAKNELEKSINQRDILQKMITYVFTGTEDELHQKIREFNKQLTSQEDAHREIERETKMVDNAEVETQRAISNLTIKTGNLQTEQKHEQKAIAERNLRLSKIAQALGLHGLQEEASEVDVNDMFGNVRKLLSSLASSISSMKLNLEKEERCLQDNINQCLEIKTNLEAEIRLKDEAIFSNENEIKTLKDKLKNVHLNLGKKDKIEEMLRKCRQDREDATRAEDADAMSAEIHKLEVICQELEDRNSQLASEILNLMKFQDVQNKLKMSEEKFSELQIAVHRLRSNNHEFISKHLENSNDSSIKHDLEMLIQKWKLEVDNLRDEVSKKSKTESTLEQNRKFLKTQLDKKKSELTQNKESLYQLCGKRKLDDVLQAVDKDINEAQNDKGVMQSSRVVYNRFIKQLEESNPCCPLCRRGFDNDLEPSELIANLNQRVVGLPNYIEQLADKLSKLQEKQHCLLALKPVEKATIRLEASEIPDLEKEISGIEENLEVTSQEIPLLVASMQDIQSNLKNAEEIQGDIFDIDRCYKDRRRLSVQIDKFKQELPLSSSSRTSDQAVGEQQVVQQDLSLKRREKDDIEKHQRAYERRLNELDQKINTLTSQKLEIEAQVRDEENIKTRLSELSSLKVALESELDDLKQRLVPTLEKKKRADEALKIAKEKNTQALQEKEKEKGDREKEMNTISELQKSIRNFQSKNIMESLKDLKFQHDEEKRKLEELKEKREDLTRQSNDLKELINGHERKRKELEENLTLIQVSKTIEKQKATLEDYEQKLGVVDLRGIKAKCLEYNARLLELIRMIHEFKGELSGLEENIKSREQELKGSFLNNAEKKYTTKLVYLTLKRYIEQDLQKYYAAIDYAMQCFHKDRMEAINNIIRELWKRIYKGNDIDYIEIKTDENVVGNTTSAPEKKKTYNYRVVQVKHGIEIEMRGRCSAGQKVLACLIIRMALAETFSVNCGILALDEPTTNLDKQNVNSLCEALLEIIHEAKKGFQLVVITHDVQFLNAMSHSEDFERYWEITRNNRSKSEIRMKKVIRE